MLEELKEQVYLANINLQKYGLVTLTWGNASGVDRERQLIVIKPSGVEYENLTPENMVVVDLEGNVLEGTYRPSSDTPTHIELYKNFPSIGGVVHTHSSYATSFAQACKSIPAYGTTHGDYFFGTIPCTRILSESEVLGEYERNTGKVIIETFKNLDENAVVGTLVANHGVFSWGKDSLNAAHNAFVLEEVAKMAFRTILINDNISEISQYILDKHYNRKHGAKAYYGQKL